RWPEGAGVRSPARRAGAYLVLVGGRPLLAVESRGRALQVLDPRPGADLDAALAALAAAAREGRVPRLVLERIDGAPAVSAPLGQRLLALGFHIDLRGYSLSRGDA
ncbi:MAG: DEAD/DEAH box helicase, partial [Thermoleophilia bacterium]